MPAWKYEATGTRHNLVLHLVESYCPWVPAATLLLQVPVLKLVCCAVFVSVYPGIYCA